MCNLLKETFSPWIILDTTEQNETTFLLSGFILEMDRAIQPRIEETGSLPMTNTMTHSVGIDHTHVVQVVQR